MHEVTYAQAGDVMFIAHQTFMVRKLVRTGSYFIPNGDKDI